jgi:DNA helicase HerA-like ATPase
LKERFYSEEGIIEIIKRTLKLIIINITQNQEKNLIETFLEEIQKFKCNEIIAGLDSLKKFYLENLVFFTSKDTRDYRCTIGESSYYSNKSEDFYENVISKQVDDLVNINLTKLTELQKIKLTINFHFFYSIQKGYYRKDHIGHILGRLENRLKDMSKLINISKEPFLNQAMTIISLKNVNIHMRKLIPLIICNQVYEEKKKENNPEKYLNLIIDEAHNILSYDSVRENETWKDYRLETFEEIIKEGRKFGVFLTIASQRPHDISATIISQLHNYFLHRLINNKDIEAIEKTVSYLDKVSFDKLSILPVGSCILAGLSAQIPVIINMDKIEDEYEPHNKTIKPTDFWD